MRKIQLLALLCAVVAGLAGCASKNIVRAAPPSVGAPPPDETSPMPSPATPPPLSTTEEPAPEVPSPALPPSPAKRPAAPRRPASTESAAAFREGPGRNKEKYDHEHYDRRTEYAACEWQAAQRVAKRSDGKNKRFPRPVSRGHHGRRLGSRAKPR